MPGRLEGKVAVVVGAGSIMPGWGNGKATAVLFAQEGAKVVCIDRNRDAAAETVDIIARAGGVATAVAADAAREADIETVVKETIGAYGRIDILHDNVGIAELGGVCELSESDWDRVFAVNVKSCFLTMKHVIPVMVAQGGGSIVNVSSIASIRYTGVPYATYSATKAAMNHLSRTTAVEYAARKVRVNCILPGLLKTPMVEKMVGVAQAYGAADVDELWRKRDAQIPMGHMGDAWDVARAALFLASDESRYVTGIELVVDGGLTLKFT